MAASPLDAAPRICLKDGINATSRSIENLVALYQLKHDDRSFIDFRSQIFCEAMLYAKEINPQNVLLAENLRNITSTIHEAFHLRSATLFRKLPSVIADVGARADTLARRYTGVIHRLKKLEHQINDERTKLLQQSANRSFISMIWSSKSASDASSQFLNILQSSVRDLIKAITLMQEFVQWMQNLASSVRQLETGQLERLANSWITGQRAISGRSGAFSYLEVLGPGATIVQEYQTLRSTTKEWMQGLYSIPDNVSGDYKEQWFQEIKEGFTGGSFNA